MNVFLGQRQEQIKNNLPVDPDSDWVLMWATSASPERFELLIATCTAWADPSGTYDVKGVRPDGTAYEGQFEIAKIGDVYELNYTFSDSSEQQGSAIGDDSFLAYGYGDDEELGVGLMASKEGN